MEDQAIWRVLDKDEHQASCWEHGKMAPAHDPKAGEKGPEAHQENWQNLCPPPPPFLDFSGPWKTMPEMAASGARNYFSY